MGKFLWKWGSAHYVNLWLSYEKKKKKSNYEIRNWLKYLKLILRIESQKITKIVAKMFNGAKIISRIISKKDILKELPKIKKLLEGKL